MEWHRRYHGTNRDPKLELVARRAKLRRPFAIAAWDSAMEFASANAADRGSVAGLTAEWISIDTGCTEAEAARLLGAMLEVGLIRDDRLSAWEKRNPSDPTAAERMRRMRERKRAAANGYDEGSEPPTVTTVTPTVTNRDVTALSEQNRVREDKITPPSLRSGTPPGGEKPNPRGCRIPDGFEPDLAEAERLGLKPPRAVKEAANFRDYYTAAPGAKGRKIDWPATWRVWCRKAADDTAIERAAKGAEVDIRAEARRYGAELRARREAAEREASDALH